MWLRLAVAFSVIPSLALAWQLADTGILTDQITAPDGSPAPQMKITTSKGVWVEYTRGPSGVSYVLGTYHASGSKSYGTSWGDTQLYMANQTQAPLPQPPATANQTTNFSSIWTKM